MLPITAAQDGLRATLSDLLDSGTDTNPALNALLADYTAYHRVLVVLGGLFLIASVVLTGWLTVRFRRARTPGRGWSAERRICFGLGLLSACVALFLALVVAANLSNVIDPRTGFAGALGLLGAPRHGTAAAELHDAFASWLRSGGDAVPPEVSAAIDDRLAWQRPKAVICSVLLVAALIGTALAWRSLARGRRRWPLRLGAVLGTGACLLLMLMVLGNVQGSIAPLSLTLFFG